MHISETIVLRPRASRWRSVAAKTVATLLLSGMAASAQADIIYLSRFIDANESFPVNITGQVMTFTFDVGLPTVPGPILKHGEQHYYYQSLVQVTYIKGSDDISKVFGTPQDLGLMTKAVKVNQSFTSIELIDRFKPATSLKQVYIQVDDLYRPGPVAEPAQWMLMIGGFAGTGAVLRRGRRMTGRMAAGS